MIRARARAGRRLGWTERELATSPYAAHYRADMAPLAPHACDALAHGRLPLELLPTMADVTRDRSAGGLRVASGYALEPGGGLRVTITTPMPDVTPVMVDWWFGWHSDAPERYRLWHPRAHVHAEWLTTPPPESEGRGRYVGSTSVVDEYVGGELGRFRIGFLEPTSLGYERERLEDARVVTAVCARAGLADVPLDVGYLIHEVWAQPGGSEMRSYFWLGGAYAAARGGGALGRLAVSLARQVLRPGEQDARAMLAHCAEEMAHLATFLPRLYGEERSRAQGTPRLTRSA